VCNSTFGLLVCNNTNLGSMVGNNTKARSPLLPDRMQQGDFFVSDIFDAAPKGDMASMEHPVFSISTKPDKNIRRYENGDVFVEVVPSPPHKKTCSRGGLNQMRMMLREKLLLAGIYPERFNR
jgi:hypothetical protein